MIVGRAIKRVAVTEGLLDERDCSFLSVAPTISAAVAWVGELTSISMLRGRRRMRVAGWGIPDCAFCGVWGRKAVGCRDETRSDEWHHYICCVSSATNVHREEEKEEEHIKPRDAINGEDFHSFIHSCRHSRILWSCTLKCFERCLMPRRLITIGL